MLLNEHALPSEQLVNAAMHLGTVFLRSLLHVALQFDLQLMHLFWRQIKA